MRKIEQIIHDLIGEVEFAVREKEQLGTALADSRQEHRQSLILQKTEAFSSVRFDIATCGPRIRKVVVYLARQPTFGKSGPQFSKHTTTFYSSQKNP